MGVNRSSSLMEIMKIDDEIREIVKSSKYRHIQRNLDKLRRRSGSVIEVDNPSDGKKVRVRWNGDEFDKFLEIYENQMKEYRTRLDEFTRKEENINL